MEIYRIGFKKWTVHIAVALLTLLPFALIGKWADLEFTFGLLGGAYYTTIMPIIVDRLLSKIKPSSPTS